MRVTSTGGTQLSTGHTESKYALSHSGSGETQTDAFRGVSPHPGISGPPERVREALHIQPGSVQWRVVVRVGVHTLARYSLVRGIRYCQRHHEVVFHTALRVRC